MREAQLELNELLDSDLLEIVGEVEVIPNFNIDGVMFSKIGSSINDIFLIEELDCPALSGCAGFTYPSLDTELGPEVCVATNQSREQRKFISGIGWKSTTSTYYVPVRKMSREYGY